MTLPVLLLLILLTIASVTDSAWQKIYNWNTYSGILLALGVWTLEDGWDGFLFSLEGFLLCGVIMVICFVLFGVGGGDVKLIAMMGAFLGIQDGVEAMLWTFVLGAVMAVVVLIWRLGFLNIVKGTVQHFRLVFRSRSWVNLTEEERKPLKLGLFLAPAALAAVLIMKGDFIWNSLSQLW